MRTLPPKLIIGLLLTIFIGVSLFLRIYLPYNQIFVGDWIKFSSNDAYYYMRIVDNLAHNFPHLNNFDPYLIYPGGWPLGSVLFFAWLLAGAIWVISLGSPTQHIIDVVGAYYPAVLAALTVIPVYFIGKKLFHRWAGVIAAALIAIMPGEFLGRSILAFTDQHVAETLFTAIAMLFLILAVKAAGESRLTFSHLKPRHWEGGGRTLVYSLLAGISLGIYMLTWLGGLLFIFIISVYFILQSIIDHLRGRSLDYLCITGVIAILIATLIFAPFSPPGFYLVAMLMALALPAALSVVSRLMTVKRLRPVYYPLALLGIGVIGLVIFYFVAPALLRTMLEQFGIFTPTGPGTTTLEMQPLFSAGFILPWGNFTTGFFLGLISLGIFIYLAIKQGKPENTILVVWSLIILLATLGQRRFAYYFAVNVALLTGYLAWQIIWHAGLKKLTTQPDGLPEKRKEKQAKHRPKRRESYRATYLVNTILAAVIVLSLVLYPNIDAAITVARNARFAPSDAWYSALDWMRNNTPDPFGNPDFYYQPYPKGQQAYNYPASAYGVAAWWDYGYWISRVAHRLPNTNPSQGAGSIINITRLFLAQEEAATQKVMQALDARYVVIDHSTTVAKFWAIVTWAGKPQNEFFEEYYIPQRDRPGFARLYYPAYYRSVVTRLYNFDGKAVTPQATLVIAYEEKVTRDGQSYKQITNAQSYPNYADAAKFIESQKSGNYRIVGNNPFISPVPLEALKDYRLVYSSSNGVAHQDVGQVPEVKVFEYTGARAGS